MCSYTLKLILLSLLVFVGIVSFRFPKVSVAEQFAGLSIVFPLLSPKLSSKYGLRKHPITRSVRHHKGVDLQAPRDSHVRAVLEGTIIFADTYSGYGKLVTISHEQGYYSLYGHLNELLVNPGQKVKTGGLIGRVGSTGRSTGAHLHFEWRRNGKVLDPLKVFPALAITAEG